MLPVRPVRCRGKRSRADGVSAALTPGHQASHGSHLTADWRKGPRRAAQSAADQKGGPGVSWASNSRPKAIDDLEEKINGLDRELRTSAPENEETAV